ncbi:phosphatidylinositolN-acetyglucosaminlytransferase subunit P-related [Striga asiatica]|uniref:PhosphatidylinositolN-acetyglucosaminlytransferase subunit P-related n=1 Tax=Striga asiatica TaxID=4170 RepID=A0A5A7PBP3_STRAF|nr:phosphatidylinositolN-acetyglucosaminlytransferase subunit P-related [Striga asiatica]
MSSTCIKSIHRCTLKPGSIYAYVEEEIQPRHNIFEEEQSSDHDQGICTRISPEGEESAFEYVEAVLLGSGLNWDEFLLRWLSSYEILDSSLFDEVELFSSRPHHDQKLLFDCANEALEEVCKDYFGCFNGKSRSTKTNVRPLPKGMDLIHDVWERVEKRLLHNNSQSLPLDGLLKRDLVGSTENSDVELIVQEVEEIIFDELVDEIFLGCFRDCAFEREFDVCYSESTNIKDVDS